MKCVFPGPRIGTWGTRQLDGRAGRISAILVRLGLIRLDVERSIADGWGQFLLSPYYSGSECKQRQLQSNFSHLWLPHWPEGWPHSSTQFEARGAGMHSPERSPSGSHIARWNRRG